MKFQILVIPLILLMGTGAKASETNPHPPQHHGDAWAHFSVGNYYITGDPQRGIPLHITRLDEMTNDSDGRDFHLSDGTSTDDIHIGHQVQPAPVKDQYVVLREESADRSKPSQVTIKRIVNRFDAPGGPYYEVADDHSTYFMSDKEVHQAGKGPIPADFIERTIRATPAVDHVRMTWGTAELLAKTSPRSQKLLSKWVDALVDRQFDISDEDEGSFKALSGYTLLMKDRAAKDPKRASDTDLKALNQINKLIDDKIAEAAKRAVPAPSEVRPGEEVKAAVDHTVVAR